MEDIISGSTVIFLYQEGASEPGEVTVDLTVFGSFHSLPSVPGSSTVDEESVYSYFIELISEKIKMVPSVTCFRAVLLPLEPLVWTL